MVLGVGSFPLDEKEKEERSRKELLVLFLRKGQAFGPWKRVSGGKEFGKVSTPATWRVFFLTAGEESQKGAEKESLALFLKRGDRRKRVKRPRKSAAMSVDVFCRIVAVWLEERSSSPPCGLVLVSPNLSAASSTW